jgi:hypothetical protein
MTPDLWQVIFTGITALTAVAALLYAVRQVQEAKKARVLEAYLIFESRLTSESARLDRRCVYEKDFEDPKAITHEDRETIERVCVTFDILGVLVREELMYRPLVFKPFYDVIIKCWKKTFDFIEFERRPNRKANTYMQDFEYLYLQAEAYRKENGFPEVTIH